MKRGKYEVITTTGMPWLGILFISFMNMYSRLLKTLLVSKWCLRMATKLHALIHKEIFGNDSVNPTINMNE